jgi:hypothetical protein
MTLRELELSPILPPDDSGAITISSTLMENHSPPRSPPASNGVTLMRRRTSSLGSNNDVPPQDEQDKIHASTDVVDECSRLSDPLVISSEPTPHHGGEYAAIAAMLRDAEREADPNFEERARRMESTMMTKFNPRGGPETRMGAVDYCCSFFQCCAMCIEG